MIVFAFETRMPGAGSSLMTLPVTTVGPANAVTRIPAGTPAAVSTLPRTLLFAMTVSLAATTAIAASSDCELGPRPLPSNEQSRIALPSVPAPSNTAPASFAATIENPDNEYEQIYEHFARLLKKGKSDVSDAPLKLVADAFLLGARENVAEFHWK